MTIQRPKSPTFAIACIDCEERWMAYSKQRFAFDKWISCRLVPFMPLQVVAQEGHSPNRAKTHNGGEIHAAAGCGTWLK
jgi:hypothetical protein